MAWPTKTVRRGRVPQRQSSASVHIPAPVGGLNTVSPASAMPAQDCLQLKNMIPFQYGLRVRSGYREWATSLGPAQATYWVPGHTYALNDVVLSFGNLYRCSQVDNSGGGGSLYPPTGNTTYAEPAPSTLIWTYIDGLYPYPPGNDTGSWVSETPLGVRTLLGFTGSRTDGSADRLWAVTADGIYDVTLPTSTPVKVYAFAFSGVYQEKAGRGVGTAFVNVNGDHYFAYCDGYYGYLLYSERTDTWAAVTQGSTPGTQIQASANSQAIGLTCNPANFRFVMQWKSRLWFVEEGSTIAWYLDIGAFAGDANHIPFAPRFKSGGELVGLWAWTVDGGTGIDDHLVGISSGGDVVIYAGTDPSLPGAFLLKGVWWVGRPPPGRNIASTFGGDLFILSVVGCTPLSKLVSGAVLRDPSIASSLKVANLFNTLMTERNDALNWAVTIHPTDNTMVVNVPPKPGEPGLQMVMSLANQGWAQHVGVPMACMETWRNKLFFGTSDGRVCVNEGAADNLNLTPVPSWAPSTAYSIGQLVRNAGMTFCCYKAGTSAASGGPSGSVETYVDGTAYWGYVAPRAVPIEWGLQTAFQNAGTPDKKRVHMVRPYFVTDGTLPGIRVAARFDFDVSDVSLETLTQRNSTNAWDVALWDQGVWDDSTDNPNSQYGVTGLGSNVSIVLTGSSATPTTFVGFDVMVEKGGLL